MGLFDYVRCEYPLPEPELQGAVFQTQSMPGPQFGRFLVTRAGELVDEKDRRQEELIVEVVRGPMRLTLVTESEFVIVMLQFENRRVTCAAVTRKPLHQVCIRK